MAPTGAFTPVLHKHTSRLDLTDLLSVGVDKMQRNFEPMKAQINDWQAREISSDQAKLVIYQAFIEHRFPVKLMAPVNNHYFTPQYQEFVPRTLWSLSNAFTSAFKKLTPVRQFQLTAKLGNFLQNC